MIFLKGDYIVASLSYLIYFPFNFKINDYLKHLQCLEIIYQLKKNIMGWKVVYSF